jgi:hypothetical protein
MIENGFYMDYYVNNPYDVDLTILSDIDNLNKMKILPQHTVRIGIHVPKGFKPFSRNSTLKGKPIVWIGTLDVDAPDL